MNQNKTYQSTKARVQSHSSPDRANGARSVENTSRNGNGRVNFNLAFKLCSFKGLSKTPVRRVAFKKANTELLPNKLTPHDSTV
jgi:hypothetical protein